MSNPVFRFARWTAALALLSGSMVSNPNGGRAFALSSEENAAKPSIDRAAIARLVHSRGSLALGGRDAVELVETGVLTPGQDSLQSSFDGQSYRFANAETKSKFDANPKSYAPVLAGDSIVAWADQKELKAGNPDIFTVFGGKIYLFADENEKKTFDANPKNYLEADLLLQGFSPVSLVDDEALRRGTTDYEAHFDGWRILLASEEELAKFKADPGKYFPTLAGMDPVAVAAGSPAPGLARFSVVYKNRLYVTSSIENRDRFLADPKPYSDFDVTLDGNCPVTLAEEKRKVPGHYGISTVFRGVRYLFANEASRKKFLEDPSKYAVDPGKDASGSRN